MNKFYLLQKRFKAFKRDNERLVNMVEEKDQALKVLVIDAEKKKSVEAVAEYQLQKIQKLE